ncbi:hypothetical protein RRG08_022453 [Elysia crispata]|uniref:Uncharacterized protein n=1 Tax=Elysia crispata TaxID=231223 RepID=A0AAE0Z1I9_9GAST|nr:hypothetical protein RRG08_022453 [Elysia crispata]
MQLYRKLSYGCLASFPFSSFCSISVPSIHRWLYKVTISQITGESPSFAISCVAALRHLLIAVRARDRGGNNWQVIALCLLFEHAGKHRSVT